MVRWVVGSILHGAPIELFLVPAMCFPVCGMMHIKEPLLLSERVAHVAAPGFLSRCFSGPLPLRHITVNKMC